MKNTLESILFILFMFLITGIIIANNKITCKLQSRVDFLETQWKGQEFWRTNLVIVWQTNYVLVITGENR